METPLSPQPNQIHCGMLTLEIESDGDTRCIRLRGELDLASAEALEAELGDALEDGQCQILVDMRELTFIDSTGIAILVAALRDGGEAKRLRFLPSRAPAVSRVMDLTGVGERLPLADGGGDRPVAASNDAA
jgi:anti-anti-sigma factor